MSLDEHHGEPARLLGSDGEGSAAVEDGLQFQAFIFVQCVRSTRQHAGNLPDAGRIGIEAGAVSLGGKGCR